MSYTFDIYRRMLQGDWAPLYFPLEAPEQLAWYRYLSQAPEDAVKQVYAQFTLSETDPPSIQSLQAYLLERHRMPTFVEKKHTVQTPENISGETLLTQVLEHLSLSEEAVLEWYHWQDGEAGLHVELFARYPLEALSSAERRYHFFQCLLTEQRTAAQQPMLDHVHQTTSRKQARKYVQDNQRALLTYAELIKTLISETPLESLPSGAYTLPDIYFAILQSLKEMEGFLAQHFSPYLDPALPTINAGAHSSGRDQQLETLLASLQTAGIHVALLTILKKALIPRNTPGKFVNSISRRYQRQLRKALDAFVAQESVDQQALQRLLIRQNFNDPAFIAWCSSRLQEEITSVRDINERLQLLYRYRKVYRQLPLNTTPGYHPNQPTAHAQLLGWIEEEIAYLKQVGDIAEPALEASPRIKTNLSVPELSLLIRAFFEVEVLPEQTKAHVYRQFSQIFDSVSQEGISVNTLRDHQYRPSRHTIASLKDKVIAMMNFLNQL
uniref:Uncharacterized protein n=1 Tax=Roseihalotalea indica TaxID=2867963 RepID=A0AA49GKT5_9BACT|nr:hypothetical protein K4G66_18630 [Tunicatimonas sp. TK19036]